MKISTKGRYGLRILIDLATHDPEKPRMLKDIAQSQQISEKYISRLVIDLRRAKLVRSVRGVNGGFHLAKLPEQITLKLAEDIYRSRCWKSWRRWRGRSRWWTVYARRESADVRCSVPPAASGWSLTMVSANLLRRSRWTTF